MGKLKVEYDLSLTDDMTVREVERVYYEFKKRGFKEDDPDLTLKVSALKMWKTIEKLRFTDEGTRMKIRDLREKAVVARSEFIIIHRVNFSAYSCMTDFYDWCEEKRRLSTNAKRYWKKTEETFRLYQSAHKAIQEYTTWCVLQDHLRLVDDAVKAASVRLEPSITNVFISQRGGKPVKGQLDDIELLAKASVVLLWMRVIRHSYAKFFKEQMLIDGVDFSYDFKYADLSGMSRNFCWMLQQMGVKLVDDKNGDKVLAVFSVDNSSVIETEWNKVMAVVNDDDLVDEKAREAIGMNEKVREKYAQTLKAIDDERMEKEFERLGSVYKVVKK